ncbi:MAG: 50S ribosomal protein L6, partial [Gammaproteobacteria bacterium]|nr:50S ribosomal protein L6 [Gammaproteobacteria bacterium]
MSRVAKNPITISAGIDVNIAGKLITIKNSKATLTQHIHEAVEVVKEDNLLKVKPKAGIDKADAFAGTTRALLNNMVIGLEKGIEKKLTLIGVGDRAQMQG